MLTRTHLAYTKIEQRQKRVLDFLQPFCIKAKWRKDELVLVIFLNRKGREEGAKLARFCLIDFYFLITNYP